ncbi:hypothetical protein [Bizionia sp.]|uniref:hypothetical protein n=1 Tax=Bizionia sp. TaxID=1954480 RepID=UPI003A90EF6C
MNLTTLLKLKASSPEKILRRLIEQVRLEQAKEKPNLPHIAIGLHGGAVFSGFLLDYNLENEEILLGIFYDGKPQLTFCNCRNVLSVELQNGTDWLYALSDGALAFNPSAADAPPSLELKRIISSTVTELSTAVGHDIQLTFDLSEVKELMQQYTAKLLLTTVAEVIAKIVDNALGKEALQESVSQIQLKLGEEKKVELLDKVLTIECKIENGPRLAWKHAELQEAIEEKL